MIINLLFNFFINILRQNFMFHKKLMARPMQKYIPYLNNGRKQWEIIMYVWVQILRN